MQVPGLKMNLSSTSAGAQNCFKAVIATNGSSLDLGPFSVELTRFDYMDPRVLTIAKKIIKTKSGLCAISGKMFGNESVL